MFLKPLGAQVAQLGLHERNIIAENLLGSNTLAINNYIANGVCYDRVAYVRFLLRANITPTDLVNLSGPQWALRFSVLGSLWNGAPIAVGKAVLFRRPGSNHPFHFGISLGGRTFRAVNGNHRK